jgi:hypothetical protein
MIIFKDFDPKILIFRKKNGQNLTKNGPKIQKLVPKLGLNG